MFVMRLSLVVNLISFNLPIHRFEKSRRNFFILALKYTIPFYGQLAIYHKLKFGKIILHFLPSYLFTMCIHKKSLLKNVVDISQCLENEKSPFDRVLIIGPD